MSPRSITRTVTITLGQVAYDALVQRKREVGWHAYAKRDDHAAWEAAADAVAVAVEQDIATRLAQALGVPVADLDSLLATAENQAKELTDASMAKALNVPRPKPFPIQPPPFAPTAPPFEPKQPDPSDIPWERWRRFLPTEPSRPFFIPPADPAPYVVTTKAPPYDDSHPTFIPSDS